jgi:hypothetical protein
LPTTQNCPSAKHADPAAQTKITANINDFMVLSALGFPLRPNPH